MCAPLRMIAKLYLHSTHGHILHIVLTIYVTALCSFDAALFSLVVSSLAQNSGEYKNRVTWNRSNKGRAGEGKKLNSIQCK